MAARLLIADDEAAFAGTLAEHLRRCGYDVVVALDANEALERVKAQPPDVALVDLKLPGLGGEELIRQITGLSPRTRMIVVTAYHDEELQQRCLGQPGVVAYLYKPIRSLVELERQIQAVLDQKSDKK